MTPESVTRNALSSKGISDGQNVRFWLLEPFGDWAPRQEGACIVGRGRRAAKRHTRGSCCTQPCGSGLSAPGPRALTVPPPRSPQQHCQGEGGRLCSSLRHTCIAMFSKDSPPWSPTTTDAVTLSMSIVCRWHRQRDGGGGRRVGTADTKELSLMTRCIVNCGSSSPLRQPHRFPAPQLTHEPGAGGPGARSRQPAAASSRGTFRGMRCT
jgi:hypothetical protein